MSAVGPSWIRKSPNVEHSSDSSICVGHLKLNSLFVNLEGAFTENIRHRIYPVRSPYLTRTNPYGTRIFDLPQKTLCFENPYLIRTEPVLTRTKTMFFLGIPDNQMPFVSS